MGKKKTILLLLECYFEAYFVFPLTCFIYYQLSKRSEVKMSDSAHLCLCFGLPDAETKKHPLDLYYYETLNTNRTD